jgi:hypothetical protein
MRSSLLMASMCVVAMACSSNGGSRGARGRGGAGGEGGDATGGSSGTGGSGGSGGAGGKAGSGGSGGKAGSGGSGGAGGNAGTGGSGGTGGDGGSAGTGGTGGDGGSAGGQGGDAGTGTPDAAADGPVSAGSGCTGVMASFCDDFEMQTASKPPSGMFTTNIGGGATFNIDGGKAFSGTKSAHVHVPAGSGGNSDPTGQMTFTKQFPVAMNDLHGRVMLWLNKNPNDTNKPNLHWDLLWANGGKNTYTLGSMYNDKAKTGAFMPVYQPGDQSIDTATPFPEMRWACIQWEFRFGGAGGDQLVIKMDGKNIDLGPTTAEGKPIMGNHIAAWAAGPWSKLVFGYTHYGTTPIDVDLWFDDLAFGPQEIPCPSR